jgi:hypothetical protein
MSEIVDKNFPELSEQIADLQVKALLRVIYEIGGVLEKHGGYAPRKSTGTVENVVRDITDSDPTRQILSREQ